MNAESAPRGWRRNRGLHVGFAALFPVAVLGFIAGVENPDRPKAAPESKERAEPAQNYLDQRVRSRGINATLYSSGLASLRPELSLADVTDQTEADRKLALAARAERRAYEGAPPVIPHSIDERSFPDCASCHAPGKNVSLGGKLAPTMSHPAFTSCTQCHAPLREKSELLREPVAPQNEFSGRRSRAGTRAWDGAPPTIPHSTWMRENCSSCHGPGGKFGLKTSHPSRQSCTQCHAPSAEFDQHHTPEVPP